MSRVRPSHDDNVRVSKTLSIKASDAKIAENQISGAAAALGNIDRGGDVLLPGVGCFSDALAGFLASGFVAVGHDWGDLPVAMPTRAEEQGRILYTEATFHSTARAQEARTVAMERQAAGLSVGLSIGFRLQRSGYSWFESGEELLAFAIDTLKINPALLDSQKIAAHNDYCRGIWKIGELYEYSLVSIPMNPEAIATDAKNASPADAKNADGDAAEEASRTLETITIRDFERILRDCGVARDAAVAVASKTFAALRRDAAGTTGETPDDVSINAHKRLARQAAARFESISALIDGNYAL